MLSRADLEILDELEACEWDAARFNESFLNGDVLDPNPDARQYQHEICDSVARYGTTVVYSGNMLGKDFTFARLKLWWLATRPGSLVIVTGPTQNQIGTILWKETRRALRGANLPSCLTPRITDAAKASPQVVDFGGGWQALGYSTKNVERASGQHAGELLVLVIEGSGVEPEVWEALDGLGAQRMAINGNPIRADGRFVELIRQAEKDRQDGVDPEIAVNAIRIPSTDSPHFHLEKSPFGLADQTWYQRQIRQYGRDSLWIKSHVLAEIPAVSADTLIPESWLDFAARPDTRLIPDIHPIHKTRRIACDLGEGVGRDSTAIVVRDDWRILDVVFGAQLGLPEAAEHIRRLKLKWNVPDERISYDRVGIGRDFPAHLHARGIMRAKGYAGAASPSSGDFTNLRTQGGWRLRQRLNPEHVPDTREPHKMQPWFHIPTGAFWHRLREELRVLTYDLCGRQTRLMPKEEWAETLGHSPDLADALIQSFAW